MVVEGPAARLVLMVAAMVLPLLVVVDGAWCAARQPRPFAPRPYNRWWAYLLVLVAMVAIGQVQRAAMLARLARAFTVRSVSMLPTLGSGDHVLFAPARGRVARGDVVAYQVGEETRLQRVVGLGGDTLEMRGGLLFVNGRRARE